MKIAERAQAPSRAALVLLLLAVASPVVAQYRAAGTGLDLLPNRQEELTKAMQQARWNWGGLRVAPWIGVRNITYEERGTPDGPKGELTATAGAGLKGYLPLGAHGMFSLHALPEYTWWQKQSDRNTPVGHYGAGYFLWGNRVEGEATAQRVKEVTYLSSDLLIREPQRTDVVAVQAQVRIAGSIALFVRGHLNQTRILANSGIEPIDPAALLDRDEDEVRVGVRYVLRGKRGYVGGGALQEHHDFIGAADVARSNEGSSWYSEISVTGNHFDVATDVTRRNLQATGGGTFPGYDGTNGAASITFHPGWRTRYQAYGLKQLRYTAISFGTFAEEQRQGLRFTSGVAGGSFQAFYETGKDRYFGTAVRRDEDVTAYGTSVEFPLGRYLSTTIGARRTQYSAPGGVERDIREITGGLGLTFGSPGEW
jgi:hypothetical protein